MTEGLRDEFGLIDHAGSDRTGIDLDESHDVGVLLLDELGQPFEYPAAGA
jgi:hypothetical protein